MKIGTLIARIVHLVAYIPLFALGLFSLALHFVADGLGYVFLYVSETLTNWSGWL